MVSTDTRDTVVMLVGNPKPDSRTLDAAHRVAEQLFDAVDTTIDVIRLGEALLSGGTAEIAEATRVVSDARWLVVASPTYKATYSGVLKCFLDQLPGGALAGVTAFPVMVGGGPHHALAPEVFLRPVLTELGASCPLRGLYLLESEYREPTPTLTRWLKDAHDFISPRRRGPQSSTTTGRE